MVELLLATVTKTWLNCLTALFSFETFYVDLAKTNQYLKLRLFLMYSWMFTIKSCTSNQLEDFEETDITIA